MAYDALAIVHAASQYVMAGIKSARSDRGARHVRCGDQAHSRIRLVFETGNIFTASNAKRSLATPRTSTKVPGPFIRQQASEINIMCHDRGGRSPGEALQVQGRSAVIIPDECSRVYDGSPLFSADPLSVHIGYLGASDPPSRSEAMIRADAAR